MLPRSLRAVPPPALWLGVAGLVPFITAAVLLWIGVLAGPTWLARMALLGQIYYGAVILSFVGAVHWGLALAGHGGHQSGWRPLGLAVLPALLGWLACLLVPMLGLALLMLGFAGVFVYDRAQARSGAAPAWYPALRKPLTMIVLVSLAAALLALRGGSGPLI